MGVLKKETSNLKHNVIYLIHSMRAALKYQNFENSVSIYYRMVDPEAAPSPCPLITTPSWMVTSLPTQRPFNSILNVS